MIRLGVNIDHVATVRQARGGKFPDTVQAALEAKKGGAQGITIHLREDRRHIQDSDLGRLKRALRLPLNLEMALHSEIIKIALHSRPEKVCIVPERRREVTTEGGLNVLQKKKRLKKVIPQLIRKGIEVSLFIDPDKKQIRAAQEVGAEVVELHTGAYANADGRKKKSELVRLKRGAIEARRLGLRVNAGHGLDYQNVGPVARLPYIQELNIGHAIVARSIFVGMKQAVQEMKQKCAIRK